MYLKSVAIKVKYHFNREYLLMHIFNHNCCRKMFATWISKEMINWLAWYVSGKNNVDRSVYKLLMFILIGHLNWYLWRRSWKSPKVWLIVLKKEDGFLSTIILKTGNKYMCIYEYGSSSTMLQYFLVISLSYLLT